MITANDIKFFQRKGYLIKKTSEPVFRVAVKRAVTILASQFVFKPTMEESIGFTKSKMYSNNLFSFDN